MECMYAIDYYDNSGYVICTTTNNTHMQQYSCTHCGICTTVRHTKICTVSNGVRNVRPRNARDDKMHSVERASVCTRKTGISHFACRDRQMVKMVIFGSHKQILFWMYFRHS